MRDCLRRSVRASLILSILLGPVFVPHNHFSLVTIGIAGFVHPSTPVLSPAGQNPPRNGRLKSLMRGHHPPRYRTFSFIFSLHVCGRDHAPHPLSRSHRVSKRTFLLEIVSPSLFLSGDQEFSSRRPRSTFFRNASLFMARKVPYFIKRGSSPGTRVHATCSLLSSPMTLLTARSLF